MCIPPQDNSGRGPTAGQALADAITIKQNGFTSLDQLKAYQEQQRNPQGPAPAPAAPVPPARRPEPRSAAQSFAPTSSGLAIGSQQTQLGGATRGSGLNVPR